MVRACSATNFGIETHVAVSDFEAATSSSPNSYKTPFVTNGCFP